METFHGKPHQETQAQINKRTVCEFWIKGTCMKGDTCGFLHEAVPDRMPICKVFRRNGFCNEVGCPFKHSLDDVKECNMYRLGFCCYGKACQFRHVKQPGPPPNPRTIEAAKPKGLRDEDLSNMPSDVKMNTTHQIVRRQANPAYFSTHQKRGQQQLTGGERPPRQPQNLQPMYLPSGLDKMNLDIARAVGQSDFRTGW